MNAMPTRFSTPMNRRLQLMVMCLCVLILALVPAKKSVAERNDALQAMNAPATGGFSGTIEWPIDRLPSRLVITVFNSSTGAIAETRIMDSSEFTFEYATFYNIGYFPSGNYKIKVEALDYGYPSMIQYYNNKDTYAAADSITSPASNIDFHLVYNASPPTATSTTPTTTPTRTPTPTATVPPSTGQGGRIAFSKEVNDTHDIYIINTDRSDLRRLTTNMNASNPNWSPDGQYIVFDSRGINDVYDRDIYQIRPDGTGLTILINNSADEFSPSYTSNGDLFFLRKTSDVFWGEYTVFYRTPSGVEINTNTTGFFMSYLRPASSTQFSLTTGGSDPSSNVVVTTISGGQPTSESMSSYFPNAGRYGYCDELHSFYNGTWTATNSELVFFGNMDCLNPGIQGRHVGIFSIDPNSPNPATTLQQKYANPTNANIGALEGVQKLHWYSMRNIFTS